MAFEDNEKFYKGAIKEYGISAQGVHWSTKDSQYRRFEAITQLLKKELSTNTIVDIGCGFAEYYTFLKLKNSLPKKYIGLDCEDSMLNVCKERFPELLFIKANAFKDELINEDYYICSGALNILTRKEFFWFIDNCYKFCKKGFVFNFLKSESYNYIEVKEVEQFCKQYSCELIIKDGYLPNDITFFLKK